jgi:phenylalanyl-tRNA synthetase beta chain
MDIPLAWLGEYVALPPTEALLQRLTEIGHMVDAPLRPTADGAVVSLEIRQNRPDCLSIVGIAREVAAAFGTDVREVALAAPPDAPRQSAAPSDHAVAFLHLRGATLDGLPAHMLRHLEAYGQRSVNPLVDLANYVMVELGQPLHVYAADQVDIASMGARLGRPGEHLTLIDGGAVTLAADDLIIADRSGPLSLAGIMGGRDSAVGAAHGDIIVEAGTFRPHLVRRTARRHGVHTEASLRSSKLLPPALAQHALRRFLALLTAYGQVAAVELWQAGHPAPPTAGSIQLAYRDIARIGGVTVALQRASAILEALGFIVTLAARDTTLLAIPPWWRTDITHAADLIEEILRIVGYGQIAPRELPTLPPPAPSATVWDQEEQVRQLLCAWGYDEVILDTFLIDANADLAARPDVVGVENPPARNGVLRPTLLPNMLNAARYLPLHIPERRLFEVGHVFHSAGGLPQERRAVAWARLRGSGPTSWLASEHSDLTYQLKAEAFALLAALGVRVASESFDTLPDPFVQGSGVRLLDEHGQIVGTVGALDHRAYGVTPVQAGYGVELYLPAPLGDRALPQRRARREVAALDLSVFLATNTTAAMVARAIADVLGEDSVATRLLDVYPRGGTDAQPQSVTFRVIYDAQRGTPKTVSEELRTQVEQRLDVRVRASN